MVTEKIGFKEIIHNILVEMGYSMFGQYDNIDVYSLNDGDKKHFYILTDKRELINNDFDFENYQCKVYESITNKPSYFGKNATWIVGTCVPDNNYNDNILLIEEDEYYFRKLVLYYTDKEIQEYCEEIDDSENLIGDLQSILKNYDKNKGEGLYSFVSKIFIKIPSLELPNFAGNETIDIQERIEKNISDNRNSLAYSALKDNIEKIKLYLSDGKLENITGVLNEIVGGDNDE